MKTTLFTIITALVLVGGIAGTTYASTNNNNNAATVLTDVSKINKIEIRGNVELYVTAGNADQVKVYNRYYAESALVQNQNGVLRITSYKAEKLVVWVTANDLRAISAFDNAQVKSFGKFSAIDLEVNLHNNATAQLNLDTYYANVNVSDHARVMIHQPSGGAQGQQSDIEITYHVPFPRQEHQLLLGKLGVDHDP